MDVTITLEEVRTAPGGRVIIGHVEVDQAIPLEQGADEYLGEDGTLRAAAMAWRTLKDNGVFTVNGKSYSAAECAEWWA